MNQGMVQILSSRWQLLGIIGSILVAGFVAVNLASYHVSRTSVRSALINNELPLTSNNIYSEIQASLLRPIYISSLMANDTFLKDWMLDGEKDMPKIVRYLEEIQKRYQVSSTFVVSANSLRYYHPGGILKTVSPHVPKDDWFFTMADHDGHYRVDVDNDEARRNQLTIFVNHKLYDYDGNFLGVTGLGLDVLSVAAMIERYRQDYRRHVYFVDRSGMVKSHPDEAMIDRANILTMPGIAQVAPVLLAGDGGFLMYSTEKENYLLSYRYIPELDWLLLVEQPESEALSPIRQSLYVNLAVSALVTLLVLVISGIAVHRFQARLELMARTDKLTGLYNRQYFDAIFAHVVSGRERHSIPLTLALFDLDNLKLINDRQGHLEGDRLLRQVADCALKSIRKSDVVARWGGDEFAVLLPNCDEKAAVRLLDGIREKVNSTLEVAKGGGAVSISVGVAEYRPGDSQEALLNRADRRLYQAKRQGRNQVWGHDETV